MTILRQHFAKSNGLNQFKSAYLKELKDLLQQLEDIDLNPLATAIDQCHQRGGKILTLGNGGSAANASHLATGISYVTRNWENPIRSMALGMDPILNSSLANDHGYENVFLRQLQVLLSPEDLVIVFSVSGNSTNILRSIEFAQAKGARTFGMTGHKGGKLREVCPDHILIAHEQCLMGLTEDVHMSIGHILGYYLEFLHQPSIRGADTK